METIIQTIVGVLIANKLIFLYQIWRSCSRYRAVEEYFLNVRLACRSAQRLALYRRGRRIPKSVNSGITAWHILVATPKEAEATIRMHCNYIFRQSGRVSVFAEEAGYETSRLVTTIRDICERSDFENLNDCEMLYRNLSELSGRMKDAKNFHEKEHRRLTGENYLTILISKPFLRHRRINEKFAA